MSRAPIRFAVTLGIVVAVLMGASPVSMASDQPPIPFPGTFDECSWCCQTCLLRFELGLDGRRITTIECGNAFGAGVYADECTSDGFTCQLGGHQCVILDA